MLLKHLGSLSMKRSISAMAGGHMLGSSFPLNRTLNRNNINMSTPTVVAPT